MADEAVLAVQNWLNKTYTGIPGFEPAPTDGHTGWQQSMPCEKHCNTN